MIVAPEETLSFLTKLKEEFDTLDIRSINIDHTQTEHIGLSASFLFDELITNLKTKLRDERKQLYIRGLTSKLKNVNNFLMAFGFLKEMKVRAEQIFPACDLSYEDKFRIFKKNGSKAQGHEKGNASTQLTDYFNVCLRQSKVELTEEGEGNLVDSFGELIDNAEQHCGTDENPWHVLGCFEKGSYYLNFSIINKGLSIYENLSTGDSSSQNALNKVTEIISSHRGFFEKTGDYLASNNDWHHTVWNVMALQEGISSKRTNDPTRGQGLMDVLQFIDQIKDPSTVAQIGVISGHSYILVDYTYPIRNKEVGQNGEIRRQIAFNEEGDLLLPQDKSKVRYLRVPFPGTIITGRFKLSKTYAISQKSKERHNNE